MHKLFFAILLLLSFAITGCKSDVNHSENLNTETSLSLEVISRESNVDIPIQETELNEIRYLQYLAFQTKKTIEHDTIYGPGILNFNYEISSNDSISITIEYPSSAEIDENKLSETIISSFSPNYSVDINYVKKWTS